MVIYLPRGLARDPVQWKENGQPEYKCCVGPLMGSNEKIFEELKLQFTEKLPINALSMKSKGPVRSQKE